MTFDDPRLVEARALWGLLDGVDGESSAERIQWADAVLTEVHRHMLLDLEAKIAALEADIARLVAQKAKPAR